MEETQKDLDNGDLDLDAISNAPSNYTPEQSPLQEKRRQIELLLQGKATPPSQRSVGFNKGPEMLTRVEELTAVAQRFASAMSTFASILKEKNEAWLTLDQERKKALKTHARDRKLGRGKEGHGAASAG